MNKPRILFFCYLLGASLFGVSSIVSCSRGPAAVAVDASDWRNPETCRECHSTAFKDWQSSHHALANRPVDAALDAEAFSVGNVTDAAGKVYQFRHSDAGGFSIVTVAGEEPLGYSDGEVVGVIGESPLRQFLIKGRDGRVQAHSLAWDPEKKEWFSVFGDEARQPREWGHWTGQGMNWNANCAACHMTEYAKNFDLRSDRYASTWTHQGISCIECHSGMDTHVNQARSGLYVSDEVAMTKNAMDNCARCHARRDELTANGFRPGDRFDDHYRLLLAEHPSAYFAGGQSREENYVYGSFMMSEMGHKGVTCMDCHNPHSGETTLTWQDNALCLRCHQTGLKGAVLVDPVAHSGHSAGTGGSLCVSCHMPERVYMGRDARRDHGFTLPDPYLTDHYEAPNACADCHADADADWINASWDTLFKATPRVLAARDRARLIAGIRATENVDLAPYLAALEQETNPYWRATWLRLLQGYAEDRQVARIATEALGADDPIEREAAVQLLSRRADGSKRIAKSIRDESLLPRITSANALLDYYSDDEPAFREWRAWADFNSDWPSVALTRAERAMREGDLELAHSLVLRAIKLEPNAAPLRHDAAILLDRLGQSDEALEQLRTARQQDPTSGEYAYAVGLLLGGKNEYARATQSLSEAVALNPTRGRWWYSLAIVQVRSGQLASARTSLGEAVRLEPENAEYQRFLQSLPLPAP